MHIKRFFCLLFAMMVLASACRTSPIATSTSQVQRSVNYIPYYLMINKADSLHIIGKYKESQCILEDAFKEYQPLNLSMYNEYYTFYRNKLQLRDYENIAGVIKTLVGKYGSKPLYFQDSLDFDALRRAKLTQKDLANLYTDYIKSINLEYRHDIEKMVENDQRVRKAVPSNNEEWGKVDSANAGNIKILVERYGYPSVKKIGRRDVSDQSSSFLTLMLHSSREARENYILNLMYESVKEGECEPSDYATVYDKYLKSVGKFGEKVLYGEFRNPSIPLNLSLSNSRKVDSIRRTIGLESIGYKNWKFKKISGLELNELK